MNPNIWAQSDYIGLNDVGMQIEHCSQSVKFSTMLRHNARAPLPLQTINRQL